MARKQLPSTGTPHKQAKVKSKTDLRIEEAIAKLVAAVPPLSAEQRVRLAEIFAEARRERCSDQ